MRIEIVGVYPFDATEPCHLIECWLRDATEDFDFGEITQEIPGQSEDNWQVPWNEYRLNADGTAGELLESSERLNGDVRVAFFFHYLEPDRPLRTPVGDLPLPTPTECPERLGFIEYEPPC